MIAPETLGNALDIQHAFQEARPFRHVMIDGFLERSVCENLLRDFPSFDRKKAVNELGEIGRKAVFESVASVSPFYRDFYRYINSKPFLDAVSELTGIPDLIADETLFGGGTHENLDGQALDVHIDFNIDERRMLHRRLNLLVYLNPEWEVEWGGSIELHSDPKRPEVNEVAKFLPLFNRAVIFETNEYSWHGFETVSLPAGKKHLSRKSFSIYLYTKDRPKEEVVAPHGTFYWPRPLPEHIQAGTTLSEADMRAIRAALGQREGLLNMYQAQLVEKEQRLRDFLTLNHDAVERGGAHVVLSSRSWRVIMLLHRIKYRLSAFLKKTGLRR
jgi:hypothetical protein